MRKLTILFVLLLIGGMQVVLAQKTISGRVTNAGDGTAVPGAAVSVMGTTLGVVTDASGNFALTLPTSAKTLKISFIGMKTKEVLIGSQKVFNVVMEFVTNELDELVVVGYGSVKKSDLTGAVSSVKGDDMLQLPTMRVDQALQGRAAGVSVQNTDGEPGGNVTIRVRGGNSILGGNNALVVIDGLQG